jgi:hypothetical protein
MMVMADFSAAQPAEGLLSERDEQESLLDLYLSAMQSAEDGQARAA